MEHDRRLRARGTDPLPVKRMALADVEQAMLVRLDLGVEGAAFTHEPVSSITSIGPIGARASILSAAGFHKLETAPSR